MATEFLEDHPELDAIFASASGGGMIAGISVATKNIKPSAKGGPLVSEWVGRWTSGWVGGWVGEWEGGWVSEWVGGGGGSLHENESNTFEKRCHCGAFPT